MNGVAGDVASGAHFPRLLSLLCLHGGPAININISLGRPLCSQGKCSFDALFTRSPVFLYLLRDRPFVSGKNRKVVTNDTAHMAA